MATTSRATDRAPAKRGQGRPISGQNDVGRERLLEVTERLLRTMPLARVTMTRIAQEAKADPALVRYYFGNRTRLLMAVAERVTANGAHGLADPDDPQAALAEHVGNTVQFVHRASFMHRLMIDELSQAGSDEARARVIEMNANLVAFYRSVVTTDAGRTMTEFNPLFLHLAVLGASDFFASAQPLIHQLVPEDTDMDAFVANFRAFLVDLVMNGVRRR